MLINYSWNRDKDIGPQGVRVENWSQVKAIVQNASQWHYWVLNQNVAQYLTPSGVEV